MTATATSSTSILGDDMLSRFASRAATYDRDNAFFQDDFDELRSAGYLTYLVPEEFGGAGASLVDYTKLIARLAYHAPATALATNMHQYWCGVASGMRA